MDPELLRAVPLDLVLARFGRHLEPPDQACTPCDWGGKGRWISPVLVTEGAGRIFSVLRVG